MFGKILFFLLIPLISCNLEPEVKGGNLDHDACGGSYGDSEVGQCDSAVQIRCRKEHLGQHESCTGSLISQEFIVGASHCFEGVQDITQDCKFMLGVSQEKGMTELSVIQTHTPRKSPVDLAILELKDPPITNVSSKVMFPMETSMKVFSDYFSNCYATTPIQHPTESLHACLWGEVAQDFLTSTVKKMDQFHFLANEECGLRNACDTTNRCMSYMIGSGLICPGDSGGLLMTKDVEGKGWVAVGVISKGLNITCSERYCESSSQNVIQIVPLSEELLEEEFPDVMKKVRVRKATTAKEQGYKDLQGGCGHLLECQETMLVFAFLALVAYWLELK